MSVLIDVAADLVVKANDSQDEQITALMDTAVDLLVKSDLVPTLLLRYANLVSEVEQLKAEAERLLGEQDDVRARVLSG